MVADPEDLGGVMVVAVTWWLPPVEGGE
jgi:hypothetical protein